MRINLIQNLGKISNLIHIMLEFSRIIFDTTIHWIHFLKEQEYILLLSFGTEHKYNETSYMFSKQLTKFTQ